MAKCSDCFNMKFKEVEGDVVCICCGLVQETCILHLGPEWRSFAEEWAPDKDRSRIGDSSSDLTTVIAGTKFDRLVRCNRIASNIPRQPEIARNDVLEVLQQKLNLSDVVISLAREILDQYGRRSKRSYKGDKRRLYFVATAINYASRAQPARVLRYVRQPRSEISLCSARFAQRSWMPWRIPSWRCA